MLVNNAGVVQGKALLDLSPEDIQQYVVVEHSEPFLMLISLRTFSVNTLAHFWTLKAFLPEMIKQKKGHIVSVESYFILLRIVGYSLTRHIGQRLIRFWHGRHGASE